MRRFALLPVLAAALSACASSAADEPRSPQAQQELDRYLAGRVAGKPESCLPNYRAQDMVVIDDNTILFRDGANRVWRADLQGGCNGLGSGGRALVTKQFTGGMLCRGEIAQVLDTASGFTVGSCALGDFIPYTGPGRR